MVASVFGHIMSLELVCHAFGQFSVCYYCNLSHYVDYRSCCNTPALEIRRERKPVKSLSRMRRHNPFKSLLIYASCKLILLNYILGSVSLKLKREQDVWRPLETFGHVVRFAHFVFNSYLITLSLTL